MTSSQVLALGGALWLAAAGPLDGDWCSPDGLQITVEGLEVVTPGGQRTTGHYRLRAFTFEIPPGERNAGIAIWMERKSESSARVSKLTETQLGPPPHSLWQRCEKVSELSLGF